MSLLLSAQDLAKSFGPRPLFVALSVQLSAGERVGLIGPNGSGKSTLLKILAGIDEPDNGTRAARRGARIGYVPQDEVFPAGLTAREILLAALDNDWESHERETRVAITLTQTGFDDYDTRTETLSGGWRKRLALARALVRRPEILLLDEPTNHLDLPGVVWLERLLRSAAFGYLVATHDRGFLRAIADEIIELNRVYPGGSLRLAGGYDDFAERRDEILEAQARQLDAVANQVRRETEWLGRKAQARTRKSSSRIEAAGRRREELEELKYRTASAGVAGIDFAATGRQTKKLLTAIGICKSLGGRPLFDGLDLVLSPGTKLGVLGPNGSGKSTLLRVLAGQTEPDSGSVTRANGARTITFEQGRAALDLSLSLRKALCPNGETVTFGDRQLHVAAWAQRFLFRAEQLNLELSALSGGEQARVRIAQLMLQPADVLFLDEPTNDLDIPSLEVLEESLAEFAGALVLVTHDRDLLDRVCTEIVGLDGRGGSASYGSVTQWLAAHESSVAVVTPPSVAVLPKAAPVTAKPKKLSFHEQKEWDQMEPAILVAEELVARREAEVSTVSPSDHSAYADACQALEESQSQVDRLYARWQELEARRSVK